MNNSLKQFVSDSQSILVLLSKNPYLDQVAAGLSLYLTLKNEGKKVVISCPTPMVVEFNRLVGVNKIISEIGDKNLVIRFKNYNAQNIERVTYDIDQETEEFQLSVIPKPNMTAPLEENLDIRYSGVSADTVILVGGANESHFPDLASDMIAAAKVGHIGKQDVASSAKRTITSFAQHKASVSELMAEYLKEFSPNFERDIASNLLAGIKEGTRDFSHTSVNADTFALAAELMRAGGDASADYNQGNRNQNNNQEKQETAKPQVAAKPSFENTKEPVIMSETEALKAKAEALAKGIEIETKNHQENSDSDNQENISEEEAPASWLEPKIFKGAKNS